MTPRKARVHMHDPVASGVATAGVCGHLGTTTARATKVTCKACLRALAAVAAQIAKAADDARRNAPPAVLTGRGQTDVGHVGARAIASSIAGEVVCHRPRWPSARAALAAWAQAVDAGRSVASSSAPSRFGKRGGAESGPTPTTPRGTQHDILDVELVLDRGCCPMDVGGHALDRAAVRAIVEARMCGRPVDRAVGPKTRVEDDQTRAKRGTYRERIEATGEDVAARYGLTRHQVGMVVRRCMAAISTNLAAKGLIPSHAATRDFLKSDSEDTMAAQDWDLDGWKDIAPLVRRSEDVCQRLARRASDPLPVRRYLGRVVAKRADIEAWALRQEVAA